MNSLALRFYTVAIALISGTAIAYTIEQQHQAASWQTEAGGWQRIAARTIRRERATNRRIRVMVRRYNQLVVDTRNSQRRLLSAARLNAASMSGASTDSPGVLGLGTAIAAPAPTPVAAPAPTTRTS